MLNLKQIDRALEKMSQEESIESFREFDNGFQRYTPTQQQEISEAFIERTNYEVQSRFYGIRAAFEQVQVVPETGEMGLAVQGQIELPGLDVAERESAIGDWSIDVSR